jgi:prephenate dehydratase
MRECFVLPTHHMVYAGRRDQPGNTVASHPAPVNLLDGRDVDISLVNSNAEAAATCASGSTDACITTLPAARRHGLGVLVDFGPVPMGFSVHAPQECDV